MRMRGFTCAILGVLLASAIGVRSAGAQELRTPVFSSAPPTSLPLTRQPLFDLAGGPPQPPASKDPEHGFGFGIKGGPLFASIDTTTFAVENKNGFLVGIWFGGNRTGTVGVEGEVMYGKKGAPTLSGSGGVDFYFIEIPILLRVNIGSQSINKWVVYGIAGPAFDIKLKANQGNLDVASNYAGLDVGIIGGAGVEIFRFLIEARGNWGVRNVNANVVNTVEFKDKSFAVLLGVRLN